MSVWVRGRKALVKAWSVAFGRTAALAARDGVWDALKLLRQNRTQVEEALRRLDELATRLAGLEEAGARAAERLDALTRAPREPAIPLYEHILAARTRAGLSICLDGRDAGESATLLAQGALEPGLDRLLGKLVQPGRVFIDVGAHTGYYTLLAASLGGPEAKVFSIEPNPALAPLIARAARANGFADRIRVYASAVSDEAGRAPFSANPYASGQGALAQEGAEVEVARLDDLLDPGLVADVVKLDAGGRELAALRGMAGLLRRSPDVRLIFTHAPARGIDLVDEMAAFGLSVWRVSAAGFLDDVVREDLTGGPTLRLVAARRRPEDREIAWEGAALARDRNGWAALGPEIPLPEGIYEAFVDAKFSGKAEIVATCEGGLRLAARTVADQGERLKVELTSDVRRFRIGLRGDVRVLRMGLRDAS